MIFNYITIKHINITYYDRNYFSLHLTSIGFCHMALYTNGGHSIYYILVAWLSIPICTLCTTRNNTQNINPNTLCRTQITFYSKNIYILYYTTTKPTDIISVRALYKYQFFYKNPWYYLYKLWPYHTIRLMWKSSYECCCSNQWSGNLNQPIIV